MSIESYGPVKGICEDKELFDDGYFEWVSTIYNNRIPKE
jgi:hypothetical protein